MTNEELVEMIRNSSGQDQGDYLGMLYNQNYGIIHKICNRYAAYECAEDLEQQSFFGLRIAVERYEPSEGSFINFAAVWIRQSIRRYLDECGSVLRLPVYLRDKLFKYQQLLVECEKMHGREPTNEEIMLQLKVNPLQLKNLKRYLILLQTASTDKPINTEEGTTTILDTLEDPSDPIQNAEDLIDDGIKKEILWSEVDALDADQAEVIRKRYQECETLQSIGTALGVTKEKIRKIESNALRNLRRSDKIRLYENEYYSAKAYNGTGLSSFRLSGYSSTERTALDHLSGITERIIAQFEQDQE